jgi:hypothetical protein
LQQAPLREERLSNFLLLFYERGEKGAIIGVKGSKKMLGNYSREQEIRYWLRSIVLLDLD